MIRRTNRNGVFILLLLVTSFICVYGKRMRTADENVALVADIRELLEELQDVEKRAQSNSNHGNIVKCQGDVLEEVRDWLTRNDVELAERSNRLSLANWNYLTNLTDENAQLTSTEDIKLTEWLGERIKEARDFLPLIGPNCDVTDPAVTRMLEAWVNHNSVPVANDKATITAISTMGLEMESLYGNAEVTRGEMTYRIEPEFTEIMSRSRNYTELRWAWLAWRDATGPYMRSKFTTLVKKMNKAAKDNGMDNIGISWRLSNYGKDDIIPMVDDLYRDILPLYQQLHAFVRHKLVDLYSEEKLDPTGPIPAHILGNMWAQQWTDLIDVVAPFPDISLHDVTPAMHDQHYTSIKMFKLAESFFMSLGLEPMVDKFWKKSMIVRPTDRPVQCHAAAQDFLTDDDFRIKMCTKVDQNYLQTIHHEMGHIEYFMQYRNQPTIYRTGANAAFHEAIGDTIALSVMTPEHLETIGLLSGGTRRDSVTDKKSCFTHDIQCTKKEKEELNQLMKMALEKVAFLPFGYLIDKWRWAVFDGNITEENYNSKWWQYRLLYQGVSPPVERSENDFDPGAKYHVPAFVPYIRYFLSFIGQFQFQRALCDEKGHTGDLNHCDIYQSKEAGTLLKSVLSLGSSEPWRDVMEKFTGSRQFSTTAIHSYFSPLYTWLQRYNRDQGVHVGW